MTAPTPGPVVRDRFIELRYTDRAYTDNGKIIALSHADNHIWTTIGWDYDREDPDHMHGQGGWSVLTAPANRDIYYSGNAALRVQGGVEGCSTHLMSYWARAATAGEADGVDNIVEKREAAEVFVGAAETHPQADGDTTYSNTHLILPVEGHLPAGLKLRFCADYWNAPADAIPLRMCGGTVSLTWGYGPIK